MSPQEASLVLGVPVTTIKEWQATGILPNPIPDDRFDAIIDFRVKVEEIFRRRIDKQRAAGDTPRG